jgi:cytochrome c553
MPHANITRSTARRAALALAALLPAAAVAADLAAQAATLTADTPHGMVLYIKHCASCHGRRAWGDGVQEIPALAGQRERYLIAQLASFINSNRRGSELHGPVMHDTLQPPDVNRAQALRDLGAWLARAPRATARLLLGRPCTRPGPRCADRWIRRPAAGARRLRIQTHPRERYERALSGAYSALEHRGRRMNGAELVRTNTDAPLPPSA